MALMAREAIVRDLRGWLEASTYPRLHASFIVFVAGAAAFLSSLLLLAGGVDSMAVRYGVAGCTGYLVFLLMIRAWIAWQRNRSDWDGDIGVDGTWIDIPGVPRRVPSSDALWSGGRSGGAGASGDWHGPGLMPRPAPVSTPQPASTSASAGWAFDVDLDDWIWIAMAVAAVFAGIIAVGYVIYAAPLLLAEVALDAALVSAAYRKLRREEAGHWAGAVLRRTWVPAAILILSLVVAGYALQRVAPEARSIGGVVRALLR